MLVGRPVNTDRTKREIFEPHGYFRTLELVRPSFAHNPTRFRKRKYRPSSRGIKQVPGSELRVDGSSIIMKDVCMKDACPSHPPHAQTARPEVKLLKHPLSEIASIVKACQKNGEFACSGPNRAALTSEGAA